MRRRITLILLLLVCGAIVNVGLAIGCVFGARPTAFETPSSTQLTGFDQNWLHSAFESHVQLPAPLEVQQNVERFGLEVRDIVQVNPGAFPGAFTYRQVAIHTCAGWPNICLVGGRIHPDDTGKFVAVDGLRIDSMASLAAGKAGREIPLRPIWPGFAINTIFYAAILWVVFFVPGMVKRTLRRRRNLCPACAYPVGMSPICTECGAVVYKG